MKDGEQNHYGKEDGKNDFDMKVQFCKKRQDGNKKAE